MQRYTSAVTLRGMFLLLCTSSLIAHARGSTNMADEVLHTEDNHCKPILVNGELMPTEPEYMPSFPVSLKGIKRNFVCKLAAPKTVSTTPPTTSRPTHFESTTMQDTTTMPTTEATTSHSMTTTPSTTSLEATTNSITDSTTSNPTTTTKSTTMQDTTTMPTTEATTSHSMTTTQSTTTQVTTIMSTKGSSTSRPTTATPSTAKIFVTDAGTQNRIFVADLQGDLRFTSTPSTNEPGYIAYDSVEKKIYWTDKDTRRVHRDDVDGGNREVVTSESSDELRGIAIAETSRTLYIANQSPKKITWVSITEGSPFPGVETDFTSGLSEELYSLEVDEEEGFLYWSMKNNIQRKPLDGSGGTQTIYHNTDVSEITGLSIDVSRNPRRIFFCDFDKNRSFYKDLNQSLTTAHELTDYMVDPDIFGEREREKLRDISYFNGALYWTKEDSPKGIAVMTNYDQSSRSFDIKENLGIKTPYQLLIINVDP